SPRRWKRPPPSSSSSAPRCCAIRSSPSTRSGSARRSSRRTTWTRTWSASSARAATPASSCSSCERAGWSRTGRSSSTGSPGAAAGVRGGGSPSAWVRQFYGKTVPPAPEILLSEELPEVELTAEWLATLGGGRRVQLHAPQRGSKRQFVAMAEANAAIALQNRLLSSDNPPQPLPEEPPRAPDLPGLPNRIEGYDISNIQGTEQVGSMVVWENGGLKKDDYKRFKIRTVAGADDFASM